MVVQELLVPEAEEFCEEFCSIQLMDGNFEETDFDANVRPNIVFEQGCSLVIRP
jgi:hypothetical protein